jgi:SAM-dependent methyltransferase
LARDNLHTWYEIKAIGREDMKSRTSPSPAELKRMEAQFHQNFAKDYDKKERLSVRRPPPNDELERHLRSLLIRDSVIIEVGCGTGLNGECLLEMGHRYIGIDISRGMLTEARNKLNQKGKADFVLGDAEYVPFRDHCADVTLAVAVLHHLPNPQLCMNELARCTKSLVIIGAEPTRLSQFLLSPAIRLAKHLGLAPGLSPADSLTKGFTKDQIKKMIEEAGLELIEIKPVALINGLLHFLKIGAWLPEFLDGFVNRIDSLLVRFPIIDSFAFHWNAYCKKR